MNGTKLNVSDNWHEYLKDDVIAKWHDQAKNECEERNKNVDKKIDILMSTVNDDAVRDKFVASVNEAGADESWKKKWTKIFCNIYE